MHTLLHVAQLSLSFRSLSKIAMIEPLVPRRRKPNQPKKFKLVCSFNGSFQPRPPSGKLRYTGGETRILSVDRNINLSRLRSKISELFFLKPNNNGFYFSCCSLIYKLTAQDDDGRLALITSDDGVYCMIDEYEKLLFQGKPTRLWIFVIKENEFVKYGNVKCGYGLFCEFCDGFIGGDRKENSVMSLSSHNTANSNGVLRNHLCECKDSMRQIIPSNHLLEKEPARIRGFCGHSGLGVQETEKVYVNETLNHDQPLLDLNPEPESTARNEAPNQQFGGDPYRASVLDYEFRSNQLNREINLGHSPLLVPNSHALYPMDGNLYGETNFLRNPMIATAGFPEQSCGSLHGGIRSHRFASIEARNQRACPYYLRNYKNGFSEFGNYRNGRVEGRHWVGKFYPGVKSGSNIAKQGQTMRLHHSRLCKPWYGYHDYLPKGISGKENFAAKSNFAPNLKQYQYPYDGMRNQSTLSSYVTKIPLTSTRVMEKEEDLLTGPTSKKLEVPCQASCKSSQGVSLGSQRSPLDFEKESQHNTPNNSEKFFNIELCVSLRKHPSCAHAIQGDIASLVDVSLRNLSLSSSKEVEPRASLSKPLDLMDEEQISSGPQVEISSGIESDSSSQKKTKLENVAEEMKPNQQNYNSTSRVDKKVEVKESHKCSKANGSIPCDLVTFYAHLARRELQTIQDSDLEYIKELGSGTYGTVFYGKWKGCDVAVKKLKSSCFVEGAPEQDRLIADFWKEARTLGQLHHPHIVALYGVVTDGPVTNLATVTEYMVNGSLKQVLRKKDRTIDRRKRLIIAMDAAFGMEYLHEKNIVHFDLKSHNLLMNMRDPQRPVCKIGDLGLSKIKQRTLVSSGIRGTISWMAPELLNSGKTMVTEKVDVFSFGIIMWELLTGEEPYGNMRSQDIIAGIIKGNLRPEIPCWCDPAWRSLMERCWSLDPNSRPAFSEIAKELRAMATAMNIK